MANLRFYKRIKIFPFVYINLSKTGISITFGGRGSGLTFGKKGVRFSAGLPGTGLCMTDYAAYRVDDKIYDDLYRDNSIDLEKYNGGENGKKEKG